jgi:hypothetical protein
LGWLKEGGTVWERDIYIDKECRSRYYSHTIQFDSQILSPHTRLPGRISTQVTITQRTEASQLGMSSGRNNIRNH